MFYETGARDTQLLPRDPFKAIVAPRPIGWISTRARDGRINLAPYSFFNGFNSVPPIVGFSSEGYKDSADFARDSGEFVANLASFDLMQKMNLTSAPLPRGTTCAGLLSLRYIRTSSNRSSPTSMTSGSRPHSVKPASS